MKSRDRELGMDRSITRRDLLHGMGALAAGALGTQCSRMSAPEHSAADCPAALTGLRGSHVGSFEVAHELALAGRRDWGTVHRPDSHVYDLVVVGGGFSGLAAAYFFLQQKPKARILILDNHDDFGGHARRNEFQVGGRTLIGYGGNQTLEEPSGYSDVVKGLLRDLGVDTERFETAYDREFFKRHALTAGIYFNRRDWGSDRIVPFDLGSFEFVLPLAPSPLSPGEAVTQMPISQPARREFLRLLRTRQDQIPDVPPDAKEEYLYT
ncbi:MAG: NAD(P)/FAD-dependent oxidoreductase, partial [bacterium]|nr:NAD(P)/FAD-dependent oxidoreductase [bacterium]